MRHPDSHLAHVLQFHEGFRGCYLEALQGLQTVFFPTQKAWMLCSCTPRAPTSSRFQEHGARPSVDIKQQRPSVCHTALLIYASCEAFQPGQKTRSQAKQRKQQSAGHGSA